MINDIEHYKLVTELSKLFEEAKSYQFHDFKNTDYPAPKMVLAEKLRVFRKKVIEGCYDNKC